MNFKQYILKNFPDAKTSRLEKFGEINIGCINPSCEDFWKNKKYKLGINVKTEKFHCFRCGLSGNSKEEFLELMGDKELLNESTEIKSFGDIINNLRTPIEKEKEIINLELPLNVKAEASIKALRYLYKRGITDEQIVKYNIKYCFDGMFTQRVLFPDYDLKGNIIFYQGRHIYEGKPKTLNATIKRFNYIYNYYRIIKEYKDKDFLIITEGIIDCLTVDNCCIALMTKHCSDEQFQMILELNKKKIYVFLDADASLDSIFLCKKLNEAGLSAYMVILEGKDDPNSIGKKRCFEAIKNSRKYNYNLLIEQWLKE